MLIPVVRGFSVIAGVLATAMTLLQFNFTYGELMQIICQQLAHAQSYCLFAALGIAEVILLRALPPGLMQNVPANIVRSAPTTDHRLAVVQRDFDQPGFVSISSLPAPLCRSALTRLSPVYDAITMQSRLRGANANRLPAISSWSLLLS
jgi:hypothetical protein